MPVSGVPRGYLTENVAYEIQPSFGGPIPTDLEGTLNDIPADKIIRRGRVVFPFVIDFYAGDLRISLVCDGRILASTDLEVDPDIFKLTRDEYASMVADIARSTLALYRLGQLTIPALADIATVRQDVVTLELVRTNFDAFEHAASRVADQPVRALRAARVATDLLRARNIDDQAIGSALRSGRWRKATASEARAAPRLVGALGGRWISEVMEDRREDRLDLYENRALLGFIKWLDGTLARIADRLSAGDVAIHPTSAVIWSDRLVRWRTRLASLARRGIFSGLTPIAALHATSVFRLHPSYASVFSAMIRMRLGLGISSRVTPSVPVDRTYVLYEIWCYIGLLHAAAEAFPACRPTVAKLLRGCRTPNGLGTALAQGELAGVRLNDVLTLTYQR